MKKNFKYNKRLKIITLGAVLILISMAIVYYIKVEPIILCFTLGYLYLITGILLIGFFYYRERKKSKVLKGQIMALEALYRMSETMDEFPDTKEILLDVAKIVSKMIKVKYSFMMLYDEKSGQLLGQMGYRIPQDVIDHMILGPGEGMERLLIEDKKDFVFSDDPMDWYYDQRFIEEYKIQCMAAVPLRFKNKIIGTLSFLDRKKFQLTEDKREFLKRIAEKVAVTLENNKLYQQVHENSITDGLTGLYNHNEFYEKLRYEMERVNEENTKLHILMIDIDRFKDFNNAYGHLVGDEVLENIGKIIKISIRDTDVAARYGGEEFAVILPDSTQEVAALVADRIRYNVKHVTSQIEPLRDKNVSITVSIGMACYPSCSNELRSLVDIADIRMYRGKEQGGDQVIA